LKELLFMRFPSVPPTFFFYVFWLLAVPMEGPLLVQTAVVGGSRFFVMAHVATLLLIARLGKSIRLRPAAITGSLLTALLTLLLFFSMGPAGLVLTALGVASAPLAVKTCNNLHSYQDPVRAAAWCLVGANILLGLMQVSPGLPIWSTLATVLPLLTLPGTTPFKDSRHDAPSLRKGYLAFVFIFQIVSGLMYAVLFPAYAEQAFMPGMELPFYMAAALLTVSFYRRDRDLVLTSGLTLAMVAFALLQIGGTSAINFSLYVMQAAAGCIDVFLLSLMLSSTRSFATFGYGLAALCGGIAVGQMLSLVLGSASTIAGLAGSLVLNAAALALVLHKHRQQQHLSSPEASPAAAPVLPGTISCQLSEREVNVLIRVYQGKNYRQTASELGISESSVKTYMKRVCDKMGVANRVELLAFLEEEAGLSKIELE
jgi:DNA-binding CsgD family transcriptional regulator